MKIISFLLLASIMTVSASTLAQKVSLTLKKASLESALQLLKQQSGYNFVCDQQLLENASPVTLKLKDASIDEALAQIFQDEDLTYTLENKIVVIKEKAPSLLDKIKSALELPADIKGTLTDTAGNTLAGANVSLAGTNFSTTTNNKGEFVLTNVPQGKYTLVITYIGYAKLERAIETEGRNIDLRLTLHNSSSSLDQVQVIAYGETTQRYNVGSVSQVTAKEIEEQPVTNPLSALEGRVPGLNVTSVSGAPGSTVMLQVRGQNTLNPLLSQASNYNQPLIIVDGVPFAPQNQNVNQDASLATEINTGQGNPNSGISPVNSINPADIENITVLKDADATSIYGSQGENGVVLITTKKGKPGKASLNISLNTGFNHPTEGVQMMNTAQYNQMRIEAIANDGLSVSANANDPGFAPDLTLFDPSRNIDWFKFFEGGYAASTNANISLSGGTPTDTYLISMGDSHTGYNFPGGFADDRLTFHSDFRHQSADRRLTVDFGADYGYDNNNSSGAPNVLTAFTLPPDYPSLLDGQGNLVWNYRGYDLGAYGDYLDPANNPLAYLKQTEDLKNYNLNSHLQIDYQLAVGLKIGTTIGYNKFDNQEDAAQPLASMDPIQYYVSSASFGKSDYQTIDIAPQLNYSRHIAKGQLTALLGGEYKKATSLQSEVAGDTYATG